MNRRCFISNLLQIYLLYCDDSANFDGKLKSVRPIAAMGFVVFRCQIHPIWWRLCLVCAVLAAVLMSGLVTLMQQLCMVGHNCCGNAELVSSDFKIIALVAVFFLSE